MALIDDVRAFVPECDQEVADRALMLDCLEHDPEVALRGSLAHLTASAWTVDACPMTSAVLFLQMELAK